MTDQEQIEAARPLLEDWARIYGVEIERFKPWKKDGEEHRLRVTAFGYDRSGKYLHHTLTWNPG